MEFNAFHCLGPKYFPQFYFPLSSLHMLSERKYRGRVEMINSLSSENPHKSAVIPALAPSRCLVGGRVMAEHEMDGNEGFCGEDKDTLDQEIAIVCPITCWIYSRIYGPKTPVLHNVAHLWIKYIKADDLRQFTKMPTSLYTRIKSSSIYQEK